MLRSIYFLFFLCIFALNSINAQDFSITDHKIVCGGEENHSSKTSLSKTLGFPMLPLQGTVKMLVVYCKFKDDQFDYSPFTDLWPSSLQGLPEWTNKTISPQVLSKYPDPSISGYFHEMSGGKLNIIGDVCPIVYVPQHEETYYYSNAGKNLSFLSREIIDGIDKYVNFADYDNNKDGIVDMIAICFRSVKDFGKLDPRWGRYQGAASLSGSYTRFDNLDGYPGSGIAELLKDGVKIRPGFGGSGTIQNNIYDPDGQLPIIDHEIGHYFFGYAFNGNLHLPGTHHHGLMDTNGGGGVMNAFERELLGWVSPQLLSGDQNGLVIKDAVLDKDIYKIKSPTGSYYIENHERRSYYESSWKFYNKGNLMAPGKGIIITKVNSGNSLRYIDIKAASGRWDWKSQNGIYLYPFEKLSPNPENGLDELALSGVATTAGIKNSQNYLGSSTDYFDFGYNQVFSPCSNPRVESDASFALELKGYSDGHMKVDLYFSNPLKGSPSKPQDVKASMNLRNHPVLSWIPNSEKDVVSDGGYKIYRAFGNDNQPSLTEYQLIATVKHVNQNPVQSFEDSTSSFGLTGSSAASVKLFYKVSAFDNTFLESVMSDSAMIIDTTANHRVSSSGGSAAGILPYADELINNYPNPFNPSTQINYSLKLGGVVTLEIFDMLGRKVFDLVNEVQSPGKHSVKFDASNFPSGTYIYRIRCGSYTESKKMMLVK